MNNYVSLSLTNSKSSVHLHALYSPRTALRKFTPRRDQLVICGQYCLYALMMEAVSHSERSVYFYETTRHNVPECCHLQIANIFYP
jgi:hypothetical protein